MHYSFVPLQIETFASRTQQTHCSIVVKALPFQGQVVGSIPATSTRYFCCKLHPVVKKKTSGPLQQQQGPSSDDSPILITLASPVVKKTPSGPLLNGPVLPQPNENLCGTHFLFVSKKIYDELAIQICHRLVTFVGYPL